MNREWITEIKENLTEFCRGLFQMQAFGSIQQEAAEANDLFILLCFGELLGIPLPTSYYTLELLPYLADELETWEKRMLRCHEVLAERCGRYDFCC